MWRAERDQREYHPSLKEAYENLPRLGKKLLRYV